MASGFIAGTAAVVLTAVMGSWRPTWRRIGNSWTVCVNCRVSWCVTGTTWNWHRWVVGWRRAWDASQTTSHVTTSPSAPSSSDPLPYNQPAYSENWPYSTSVRHTYCHTYYYWYSITHSLFHSRLKSFLFCKSSLPAPYPFCSFRFHYMDFPDCLLLLLSISVFLLFSFSVFTLF